MEANNRYIPGQFINEFNTQFGHELWSTLNQPENVLLMKGAAFLNKTPIEIMTMVFLEKFSFHEFTDRNKQMAGHMAKQIMERHGYIVDKRHVILKRREIFSTATRYKKR